MPNAQQNPKKLDARRFAALFAGFDTGNACEAEALGKGRSMRRIAAENNLRIIDVLELPDVKQAIDDQLQPQRYQGEELQEALEQAAEMREELTERTRDVRKLAEVLKHEREATEPLRAELARLKGAPRQTPAPNAQPSQAAAAGQTVAEILLFLAARFWAFEILGLALALLLLLLSSFQ